MSRSTLILTKNGTRRLAKLSFYGTTAHDVLLEFSSMDELDRRLAKLSFYVGMGHDVSLE